MEHITKEDVYMLITSSAMNKMQFLFPEENDWDSDDYDRYVSDDGKEYGKWDVPVFIMLNGVAQGTDPALLYRNCVLQMTGHGFAPDPQKLSMIYMTASQECEDEVEAILTANDRFGDGDDPIDIFNDIKYSLSDEEDDEPFADFGF